MATKKTNLHEAMRKQADPARHNPPEEAIASIPAPVAEQGRGEKPKRYQKGTHIGGYFPPAVSKQLRILAAEGETTQQQLLAEALNYLFAKHGKPEIAPIESSAA